MLAHQLQGSLLCGLQPFFAFMITGAGMVAKAFEAFRRDDRFAVFASGVSNSSSANAIDYARERDLLVQHKGTSACLVYFSTCSIQDPSLGNAGYILHKLAMEELVRANFNRHIIFRLPNLIGPTPNPHTLTNFLRNKILDQTPFNLHAKACRYLMDVDEMSLACGSIMGDPRFIGQTINITFDHPTPVPELLHYMEVVLGQKANAVPEDRGSCYTVDNHSFRQFWTGHLGHPWPSMAHWQIAVGKYYGTSAAVTGLP